MPWKYAGKSLLALGQFEKAQQCLTNAHQLDTSDPETAKNIGNTYSSLGNKGDATKWYEKSLEINNNYAPALNNLANIKRQSGKNQEALDLFMRAIKADPQIVEAYIGAAASLLSLGELDQAESFATQAIEINASIPGINEILGIASQNQQNYQQAVECYQKELTINPQSSTSLLNLGVLLLQQGKVEAAIEPLARAAAINPSEQCQLLLAQAYQSTGKLKEAIAEYRKIVITQSKNKMIPFNLGTCLLKSGSTIEAIEAFKIAIQLDESFVAAWGNLGNAFRKEGKLQEALQAAQKVLKLEPNNPTAHTNLGNIYKDLGNLDLALASTLKSLELKPDNPTAHMNLGGIYKNLGNIDQALASTLKSIELKPDNPDAHMNLGGIYKNLDNLDQALLSTLKALELKPDNPDAHMNLGCIYQDLGNLDQALLYTLKALELKPDNPTAHINLGGIYQDLGDLEQALASTLKSLELKPNNPAAHMKLGGIYKDLNNLDQALTSTLKSLELKPEQSKALYSLGRIHMALGNNEKAKKHLQDAVKINPRDPSAYYELSTMLETIEEAQELIESIKSASVSCSTPKNRSFLEFTLSNCFHKAGNYDAASSHLQSANKNKLVVYRSNADSILKSIAHNLTQFDSEQTPINNSNNGKDRIFIVGMPRSGSTLLETVLSMNPQIKNLGESMSLPKAIAEAKQNKTCIINRQNIYDLYSQMEPISISQYKYTTDKQLYNFIYIHYILTYMPAAKVIHCRRNPMDNILSMYRSNLIAGSNYTSNLEDAAKLLIAHERALQIPKKKHPHKIFTFDYDLFVNAPEANLRKLLTWLDLEFNPDYLHPEKSTTSINTASVIQARKPISNRSVGGWKKYENLLKPALKILQESKIQTE